MIQPDIVFELAAQMDLGTGERNLVVSFLTSTIAHKMLPIPAARPLVEMVRNYNLEPRNLI